MKLRVVTQDAANAFTTYQNYLTQMVRTVAESAGSTGPIEVGLVQATRERPGVRRIRERHMTDDERHTLRRTLRLAWATEAQLVLRGQHDADILPDLLHGAAGESYYAVYNSIQAFLVARTGNPGHDHAAVLRAWAQGVDQSDIVPTLWRLRVTGRPGHPSFCVLGAPHAVSLDHSLLAAPRPDHAWDDVAKALKTTREHQLGERRESWLRQTHRQRMPSADANSQARNLRPTTLIDFLWRLRMGSHYRGADMFLDGISSSGQAAGYQQDLLTITSASVTVLNTLTAAYTGLEPLEDAAKAFIARRDRQAYESVCSRWAALSA